MHPRFATSRGYVILALALAPCTAVDGACAADFSADFEWVWQTVHTQLFDSTLAERVFSEERHAGLVERAQDAQTPDALAALINPLLDSLRVSHARLFTESDPEYSMFRSMFVTRDVQTPRVHHLGMQCALVDGQATVRAVWDGYPATAAGLRRGDILWDVIGRPFQQLTSIRSGAVTPLRIRRGPDTIYRAVEPVHESIQASLLGAMRNSVRHLSLDGHDVGYVHLWSGTCPEILQEFTRIVTRDLRAVDALVLDLRDGWGGAWYEYLDPFFENRDGFFTSTIVRRGKTTVTPPPRCPSHPWFSGPMVVLINEGTRSGKEAMAFQFKKAKRAVLVGSTTAGAFAGGATYFPARDGYVLFLPYNSPILLDNQQVEGVGIAPDVRVDAPIDRPTSQDPQLQAAMGVLRSLLARRR